MIIRATTATLAIFITLNVRQTIIVNINPVIIANRFEPIKNMQAIATMEPIKFDLNRSIDSLRESFSSGDITNMIDNKVQNNSYSGNFRNKE